MPHNVIVHSYDCLLLGIQMAHALKWDQEC